MQRYVGEYSDCETGKRCRKIQGKSPGNLQATYPFQIVAMGHFPLLHNSFIGNTELLNWIDNCSGYVIAKASAPRTVQTVAANYKECVFRRFGVGEAMRHDREPQFLSISFGSSSGSWGRDNELRWHIELRQTERQSIRYKP